MGEKKIWTKNIAFVTLESVITCATEFFKLKENSY